MKPSPKPPAARPAPAHPKPAVHTAPRKDTTEPLEVLGRHGNTGQKDHKGAR